MGSGKSYCGRQLAQKAGMPFVDLDEWIEAQEGTSVRAIFEQKGEPYFREAERAALRAMSQFQDVVVSCGGGTPCFHNNMRWMNEQGVTIYLRASAEVLACRLIHQKEQRPLLKGLEGESLKAFIRSKLEERQHYYMESSVIYDQRSAKEPVAANLFRHFRNLIGH